MKSKTLSRFLLVGAASYALNVLVIAACVEGLGIHYAIAMIISYLVVTSVAHFINRRFTFSSDGGYLRELGRYNVVTIAQFLLGLLLMSLLVELAGVQYLLANAMAAVALATASYLAHKMWTFRAKRAIRG